MKTTISLRRRAADSAAHYLHEKGYQIIEMDYRKNYVEIDIIALKENTLAFVLVIGQTEKYDGSQVEITHQKVKEIEKLAFGYMKLHPELPRGMRIDAMSVVLDEHDRVQDIEVAEGLI